MFIIAAILILSFIVMFHELGHFLAAKMFKIGVVEFALGMGPKLISKRFGETVYSLRALPVGGYCAMYGEDSPESKGKGEADFNQAANKLNYKTDWEPERSITKACKGKQVVIMLAGPLFNIILSLAAAFVLTFMPGVKLGVPVITSLGPDVTVAQDAGILPGDKILAVESRMVRTAQDYNTYIATHPKLAETGYHVILARGDGSGAYQVFLKPDAATGLVGIAYRGDENQTGLFGHLSDAWHQTRHWALVCTDSLAMLFRGEVSLADMSGFIGMTSFMGNSIETSVNKPTESNGQEIAPAMSGLTTALILIVFVSVNLGIMNLIPIPALDGGRALVAWIEGAFNKTVPARAQQLLNAAGFGAVLLLIGLTTVTDVLRLIGIM